jgi:uncharacterized protein (TIGR02265 family)
MNVPPEQRIVVDDVIESIFKKGLKSELSSHLKQRLVEVGIDLDQKLKPIYPHAVLLQAMLVTCEVLWPGRPQIDGLREIGNRAVRAYFETFIGVALVRLSRAIGIRRTLARMTQNFSSTTNYTQTRLKEISEARAELWMNELTLSQHYVAGILETGLSITSGKQVRVTIAATDPEGVTYDVTWR